MLIANKARNNNGGSFRVLMAAVIGRAMLDIRGILSPGKPRRRDWEEAMAFILGPDCDAWCLELGIDYRALRDRAAAPYRERLNGDEEQKNDPD